MKKLFKKFQISLIANQQKMRMDTESEFYNRSVKSCFQDNDVEMYWAHTEGESVVAEKIYQSLKEQNLQKHDRSIENVVLVS